MAEISEKLEIGEQTLGRSRQQCRVMSDDEVKRFYPRSAFAAPLARNSTASVQRVTTVYDGNGTVGATVDAGDVYNAASKLDDARWWSWLRLMMGCDAGAGCPRHPRPECAEGC